jgi:hypothetical protein
MNIALLVIVLLFVVDMHRVSPYHMLRPVCPIEACDHPVRVGVRLDVHEVAAFRSPEFVGQTSTSFSMSPPQRAPEPNSIGQVDSCGWLRLRVGDPMI